MSYLAQGLNSGFAIGADARQKKKDREEREKLEAARKTFELDLDGRRTLAARELQNDRLVADAKRQFDDQGWRTGESAKEREARLQLQDNSQGFQGTQAEFDRRARTDLQKGSQEASATQAQLDRDARNAALDKELKFRGKVHEDEMPFKGFSMGIQARKQAYDEDPNSPQNLNTLAHAAYLNRGGGPPDVPPSDAALTNSAKGQFAKPPVMITSPEEYQKLPSGARFNFNGRTGIKP